jgi:hypothetical protein
MYASLPQTRENLARFAEACLVEAVSVQTFVPPPPARVLSVKAILQQPNAFLGLKCLPMNMEQNALAGRVALITGVSRRKGIGFAIARRLSALGASPFLHSFAAFDAAQPWGADADGPASLVVFLMPDGFSSNISLKNGTGRGGNDSFIVFTPVQFASLRAEGAMKYR